MLGEYIRHSAPTMCVASEKCFSVLLQRQKVYMCVIFSNIKKLNQSEYDTIQLSHEFVKVA